MLVCPPLKDARSLLVFFLLLRRLQLLSLYEIMFRGGEGCEGPVCTVYMYIYVCIYVCIYIYISIYIYIETTRIFPQHNC